MRNDFARMRMLSFTITSIYGICVLLISLFAGVKYTDNIFIYIATLTAILISFLIFEIFEYFMPVKVGALQ
jgi:putative flippase GtrA